MFTNANSNIFAYEIVHNKKFPNSASITYSALSKSYSQMPALSLSLARYPLGAPQRQMWKSLRRDFSFQLFFTNFLQCVFLFLYKTSSEFCGGDNICSSGKEKVYLHRKHRRSIRLYWKQLWQSQLEKISRGLQLKQTFFNKPFSDHRTSVLLGKIKRNSRTCSISKHVRGSRIIQVDPSRPK